MLKALELVGFKSFADKTRFDFPRGITAVVGPNGSGKSNVVDAIKWVLGEQSVKSLRGKEMADVIFNGSATRHALNSAETTLTLDNSSGLLPIDTPEVHITRRVYRSGEGEYLINRQVCRLRDIRELFSGTGVATEAYSVIEQGKVDVLLQSSARDRRVIFEEAAGISRFKAKKVESLRRMERVEQNLLRLSDIIEEVDSRLRGVRNQAAKARRYKEYVERLQELRTQVGLGDWRTLTEQLTAVESELANIARDRDGESARLEVLEAELLELETSLGDTTEAIRASEARVAQNRESIAGQESTIEHERARARDLEQEAERHRRQLAAMNLRAGDLQQQLNETRAALTAAEAQHAQLETTLATDERELSELIERTQRAQAEATACRTTHVDQIRVAASLENEAAGLASRIELAADTTEKCRQQLDSLSADRQTCSDKLATAEGDQGRLERELADVAERAAAAKQRLVSLRGDHAQKLAALHEARQKLAASRERATVLEELEQRLEGFGAGVQAVAAQAKSALPGPFLHVRGLVAELLQASVEMAPLVEVALGERAQHFVVDNAAEFQELLARSPEAVVGRVGFLPLEPSARQAVARRVDLHGRPGVVGSVDRFVETAPHLIPLAQRLLGNYWIVESLSHAIALAAHEGAGQHFVTLAGELLAADGTLWIGNRHASSGLISRRSELRELRGQIATLEAHIEQDATAVEGLVGDIESGSDAVTAIALENEQTAAALGELRLVARTTRERLSQLDSQIAETEAQSAAARQTAEEARARLADVRTKLAQVQTTIGELEAQSARLVQSLEALDRQRVVREQQVIQSRVELAKSDERLENLRTRRRQFENDRQERRRTIGEAREHLARNVDRARQCQFAILNAEMRVAELYLHKEGLAAQTVALINQRESQQAMRTEQASQAQQIRAAVRAFDEQVHAKDLAANEIRHARAGLADRLREDYGIELAELEHVPSAEEQRQREEVEQEIADLRRKITNVGSVNLDALDELDELETRYNSLSSQYEDLVRAKDSLTRIIGKINADSRRLFAETLETVRGHFQTLFRKLFGGGQADIVLEPDVDILDSGIEIVARPPGKEPRSISLLSGGEKTLTCVALLLAIFQYRPSPFCVLDEVDAALDEANIERFVGVLHEFLAWTQFIVVTHSKKTMTCATTLYGVTMQESGVSKRVSVRFEDVSADGEISAEAQAAEDARSEDVASDETQAA